MLLVKLLNLLKAVFRIIIKKKKNDKYHCNNALKSIAKRRRSNLFKNKEYTIQALTAARSENCGGIYFGMVIIPSSNKSAKICKSSNVVLPTKSKGIRVTKPRCTVSRI